MLHTISTQNRWAKSIKLRVRAPREKPDSEKKIARNNRGHGITMSSYFMSLPQRRLEKRTYLTARRL